jgi:hypothetical protein
MVILGWGRDAWATDRASGTESLKSLVVLGIIAPQR